MPEEVEVEFRVSTAATLARLEALLGPVPEKLSNLETAVTQMSTTMATLVSPDGTTGRVPGLEKEVGSIRKKMYIASGAVIGGSAIIHWIVDLAKNIGHGVSGAK